MLQPTCECVKDNCFFSTTKYFDMKVTQKWFLLYSKRSVNIVICIVFVCTNAVLLHCIARQNAPFSPALL